MTASSSRQASYAAILEFLRSIQRGNRFVSSAQGTSFSLVASHVAVELDSHEALRPGELASMLRLDKSTISRSLSSLQARKLVEFDRDPRDSRALLARLSDIGRRLLAELDTRANESMGRFAASLSSEEVKRLGSFLALISDAADVSASPLRTRDHPLRAEIRRVTRALGLLGNSVLGTSLSSVQWHALSELAARPGGSTGQQLSAAMLLAPNTVSVLVAHLLRKKLITRERVKDDGRKLTLKISLAGRDALDEIRNNALQLFGRALRHRSLSQLESDLKLLRRFASVNPPGVYGAGLQSKRVESAEGRRRVRAFVLRELVRQGREEDAPETVIGAESRVWVLERDGDYFAALEFQGAERWSCTLEIAVSGVVDGALLAQFKEHARNEMSRSEVRNS